MLPEKWAIRRMPSNHKKINKYFSKLNSREYSADGTYSDKEGNVREYDFLIFPHIYRNTFRVEEIPNGYVEITMEEFNTYVLKKKSKTKYYYEIY